MTEVELEALLAYINARIEHLIDQHEKRIHDLALRDPNEQKNIHEHRERLYQRLRGMLFTPPSGDY